MPRRDNKTNSEQSDYLTPHQVAELLQCSYETVLAHIHLGTIAASDVSASTSSRRKPVYRIHREDLASFVEGRRNDPPVWGENRRKKRPKQGDVIDFF